MTKTIAELGEEGLLRRLRDVLRRSGAGLCVGTGDDAAVSMAADHPGRLAWTTDSMVEGTHFRFWRGLQEPRWLANMLVRGNVSDIAAMGGRPLYGLLSFGAPGSARVTDVEAFFAGMETAMSEAGAKLVGGDMVRAPQWTLTLSLTGTMAAGVEPLLRSAAKPGDGVYVTGWPGRHGAGLKLLEAGESDSPLVRDYLGAPCTTVAFAEALARGFAGAAAMDLSDGVVRDASRMAAASGVRIALEEPAFPIAEDLAGVCAARGWDATKLFLHGGEDYELLLACSGAERDVVSLGERHGLVATRIGRVEAGSGLTVEWKDGTATTPAAEGFEHFA